MGHVTINTLFQGWFVIGGLGLSTVKLFTKFEISTFTHYEGRKGDEKCINLIGLGGHTQTHDDSYTALA